jgi:Tfp pilus assembly protein PilF/uncharacterized caspase-like protein
MTERLIYLKGRMSAYLLVMIFILALLLWGAFPSGNCQAVPQGGKGANNYAIIVGINGYEDPEIPPLRCAVNDARCMNDILTKRMGFEEGRVFLLTSDQKGKGAPKKGNIAFALGSIAETMKPGGTFIFYYSGHGLNFEGENFLLTQEADPRNKASLEETALKVSKVRNYVQNMHAARVLIIVDACRTDPGGKKSGDRNLMTDDFAKSLTIKAKDPEKSSIPQFEAAATILSCGRGESSYEWTEKNNGFFTHFLMKGLEGEAANQDGGVTLNSLESYLCQKVRETVKMQRSRDQVPWMERSGVNPGAWTLTTRSTALKETAGDSLRRDLDRAIARLTEYIRTSPENAFYYKRRGGYYLLAGNFEQALADYNRIISLKPNYSEGYRERGILWYEKGDLPRAVEDFTRAISLNPGSFISFYERGNIYIDKKDYDHAIADFTKALAIIPDDLRTLHNRATAYFDKSDYDHAIADCDTAIGVNPDFDAPYFTRGCCFAMKKETELAMENFSKAISLGSDIHRVYYWRAYVYLQKGQKEKARADLKKFLEVAPEKDDKPIKEARVMLEKLDKE